MVRFWITIIEIHYDFYTVSFLSIYFETVKDFNFVKAMLKLIIVLESYFFSASLTISVLATTILPVERHQKY